tara:strand:- start:3857 stop:3979 length:123 start_codon:yes stop_codon:yes gene_type:complete
MGRISSFVVVNLGRFVAEKSKKKPLEFIVEFFVTVMYCWI